jgi:cytochrome c-type biogenesis protein CcmH/NrfF
VAGLVWVIPVVAVVIAGVGLWFAFRRWREQPTVHASAADRALVEAALHHDGDAGDADAAGDGT